MRALRFHSHGGPEVLVWEQVPDPEPGPGELLVQVAAFAVNWADLLERRGRYPGAPTPPYVLGHDVSGTVVGHGEGVAGPPLGTRVFGVLPTAGAAAELVCARSGWFYPTPDAVDDLTASGVAGPYLTADAALVTMGRLAPGEDLVVHAAAGGLGSATVQLARAYGAGRIIGTAGSAERQSAAKEFGVDVSCGYPDVVSVVRDLTCGRGVPLVVDSVGGDVLGDSFELLHQGGRLVSLGASAGRSSDRFRLHTLFTRGVTVSGFTLGVWLSDEPGLVAPSVERVLGVLADGTIRPRVHRIFAADEVAAAHRHLETRQSHGRTVVRMSDR